MSTPATSQMKRLGFSLLLLVATWLVVEAFSTATLAITQRMRFSPGRARAAIAQNLRPSTQSGAATISTELKWGDYVEVLHPYFGFVADPVKNRPFWAVSEFGFPFKTDTSPITKRSPDKLLVAVFGGSFANGTYQLLKQQFEAHATELGKTVLVLNFSCAGYKQPQQLFVLNYLLALGAEFDIVVNVDGFNEVTLPAAENVPSGVNPFYPRGWDRRTGEVFTQDRLRRMGAIEFLRDRKTQWAQAFIAHRLYGSPTLFLLWQYRDRMLGTALYAAERELLTDTNASKSYVTHGPKYVYRGDDVFFHDLADVWKNASRQMNAVCAANGIRYFHFLQPNQYVPDSKPMSAGEKQTALTKNHPYERGVAKGYPILSRAGAELKRSGVDFTDLTQIFAHVTVPVYIDDCCHLNETGYKLVAAQIYDEIYKK